MSKVVTSKLIDSRYKILKILGQGSSGSVYQVWDSKEDRDVILKWMDGELGNNELTALDFIKHVSIPQILEKGSNYYTTELIEGKTLDQLELPFANWRSLATDISKIIQAIHRSGWLHGDLKPSHILCPAAGGIRLLDLGLSRMQNDDGIPSGTPGFIAPEVLKGQPADVRSDLYSFGAILYLLATGVPAHRGNDSSLSLMLSQVKNDPIAPHEINGHLTQADSDIILKLMSRDPNKRYSSAEEVLEDLTGEKDSDSPIRGFMEAALLGCGQSLKRLSKILQLSEAGRGRFVLLHGEEGVGRSRFLDTVQSQTTLHGNLCASLRFKSSVISSFQQLGECLARLFRDEKLKQIKNPSQLAAACRKKMGGQPKVLFLDDLQFAEGSTLKTIDLLSEPCVDHPFTIVASWCDGLIHGSAVAQLPLASQSNSYYDLPLQRFDKAQSREFISAVLAQNDSVTESLANRLHQACQGKPKLLKRALKNLRDEQYLSFHHRHWSLGKNVPPEAYNLDNFLYSKLEKLEEEPLRVLKTIAVIQGICARELLEQLLNLSTSVLIPLLHSLVRLGLLRRESFGWLIVTENLKRQLLELSSEKQKKLIHGRSADVHYRIADPLKRSLLTWPHALKSGDREWGFELLERAISLLSREDQEETALELTQKGLKLLEGSEFPEVRARLLARTGNAARKQEHWDEAAKQLRSALQLKGPLQHSARLHISFIQCLIEMGISQEAGDTLDRLAQLDDQDEWVVFHQYWSARRLLLQNKTSEARNLLKKTMNAASILEDYLGLSDTAVELSKIFREENDYKLSEKYLLNARQILNRAKRPTYAVDLERAETALLDGRSQAAEHLLTAVSKADLPTPSLRSRLQYLMALLHLQRGNMSMTRLAFEKCLRLAPAWNTEGFRLKILDQILDNLPLVQAAQLDWLQGELNQADSSEYQKRGWKEKIDRLHFTGTGSDNPVRTLSEIAAELNGEHRLSRLFPKIMDQVIQVVGAERGFLMLRADDESDEMHFAAARNMDQKTIAQPAFAISGSFARKVMETGQAILTRDAQNDERFKTSDSIHELKLRSIICCPLKTRDKLIGVVYVDNRFLSDKFNDSNLNLLSAVADQAALAIENAQLAEKNDQQRKQLEKGTERLMERGKRLEETLTRQTKELSSIQQKSVDPFKQLLGHSQRMEKLRLLIQKTAIGSLPVLILGESGTGKTQVARCLHQLSERKFGPFEIVNCGAISESLLESELFGHVRGAFTGAIEDHMGVFERADGGTLYLDGIGDMSEGMQSKLLRVLESGELRRVGGTDSISVSVQILCSSGSELNDKVATKEFRQDLYFRISVIEIHTPALREIAGDLEFLFGHFLHQASLENAGNVPEIPDEIVGLLKAHPWPGNVRELKNLAERLVSLGRSTVQASDLPQSEKRDIFPSGQYNLQSYKQGRKQLLESFDKSIVTASLDEHQGNISAAARAIGIERQYFHKIMKKCGLNGKDFR
jgi:transcriptional regulator with GAF, ATPase, and Fis domain/serine/threonine protein kinase